MTVAMRSPSSSTDRVPSSHPVPLTFHMRRRRQPRFVSVPFSSSTRRSKGAMLSW